MNSTKLARKLFDGKVGKDGILDTTDWKQVRIQFAGQIASAIMSNYGFYAQSIAEECKRSRKLKTEMVALMSLEIADALIAELKKEEK